MLYGEYFQIIIHNSKYKFKLYLNILKIYLDVLFSIIISNSPITYKIQKQIVKLVIKETFFL
jgi:TFIIF-interacting CTD phosphatase-like protein